jgi:hypothetical protein
MIRPIAGTNADRILAALIRNKALLLKAKAIGQIVRALTTDEFQRPFLMAVRAGTGRYYPFPRAASVF